MGHRGVPYPPAAPMGHQLTQRHSLPVSPALCHGSGQDSRGSGIPRARGFPGCTHRVTSPPKKHPRKEASHEAAHHLHPFLLLLLLPGVPSRSPGMGHTPTHPSPPKTPSNPDTSTEGQGAVQARPPPALNPPLPPAGMRRALLSGFLFPPLPPATSRKKN